MRGEILPLLRRLGRQLQPRRRRQLLLALVLLCLAGALEMLSLAAVLPLLMGLIQWQSGARSWGVALFCLVVVLAALVRMANLWVSNRLAAAIGADLGETAFRRTLARPYRQQLSLESTQVVAVLAPQLRQLVSQVLQQGWQLLSAALLALAILTTLTLLAWRLALPLVLLMGLGYLGLSVASRARLRRQGTEAVAQQQQLIRLIQDNLASIRDVHLRGWAVPLSRRYGLIERRMRRLEASNATLAGLPRFVLEPLGMVAIALAGLGLLLQGREVQEVLPALGLLAFAAQRLLPLGQQVWAGWAALTSGTPLLEGLLDLIERPEPAAVDQAPASAPPAPALATWRRVALVGVDFAYGPEGGAVLRDLNLELERGHWLGIWGPSGCGKSTVIDLLLGLLPPDQGQLQLDGQGLAVGSPQLRLWQARLASVGAAVPLVPGSVRNNLELALVDAPAPPPQQLDELLSLVGLDGLLERPLGESGRQLSGGQRQRLGLARALLAAPDLLVLDEATSALDLEGERRLLTRLRQRRPPLTLVMVSHRRASLDLCDRVLELARADG
ncbi:ABC transporter ATP-binding protein/permease [Synechococcus sp. CS-1329]|jgi:ATP-binding cassette, subfamily B, bacterial PglK|uniref:ATP-binding cassette domain-containing protein n=1 Tax=Synechococcus sp. CS-1329 TaxID=2847975 RepID=UPI00223BA505|nr:ABC transporter ATP-binding protein [Synechococcus sp. CS-1329]MCT0218416.1 ABC transporter ATP-binding protein/permease [Synechococcus sp. CS-1329]